MNTVAERLQKIKGALPSNITLVAVSKTKPVDVIMQAYNTGQRVFGENRVQELVPKYEQMPKDIEWHVIGHLQSNKVKYIASFVSLIHSVDSLELLKEINKQAQKHNRVIPCLLQIYIAQEETKYGLSFEEAEMLIHGPETAQLNNIMIVGLMGMASNTDNTQQIHKEFSALKAFYDKLNTLSTVNCQLSIVSMGMSSDYQVAIDCGSTMIRVGSTIFGER